METTMHRGKSFDFVLLLLLAAMFVVVWQMMFTQAQTTLTTALTWEKNDVASIKVSAQNTPDGCRWEGNLNPLGMFFFLPEISVEKLIPGICSEGDNPKFMLGLLRDGLIVLITRWGLTPDTYDGVLRFLDEIIIQYP